MRGWMIAAKSCGEEHKRQRFSGFQYESGYSDAKGRPNDRGKSAGCSDPATDDRCDIAGEESKYWG